MNIGADAGMPSRRSWTTCPSSWTSSSRTKPTANFQPQIQAYAATETSIVPEVAKILNLKSARRAALNLNSR